LVLAFHYFTSVPSVFYYYYCQKALAESITSISGTVSQGNIPAFNAAVAGLAATVKGIVENAAQVNLLC
jgi:hypothetical protein